MDYEKERQRLYAMRHRSQERIDEEQYNINEINQQLDRLCIQQKREIVTGKIKPPYGKLTPASSGDKYDEEV